MRKTKIVCTLGLVSQSAEIIQGLLLAGMNVARFNFSHGTHESHKATFERVRRCSGELGIPVATLLDTKGPEVRLGEFEGGGTELKAGQAFVLTTRPVMGNGEMVSVTHGALPQDVRAGTTILLDDGLIEMRVNATTGDEVQCTVINGGPISNRKGVNVPGVRMSMPYISDKDREDILFGLRTGFDFIAASFVRTAQDILDIRAILHEQDCNDVRIIAKIENADGVENIDEILRVSDGVMVARGDMGVEIPLERLPEIQKMMIRKAYIAGKIAITATQMLESMIKQPRPTRAEVSDVANAIYDGTSAIMLSGETAAGKYPIKAVETMARIAAQTEKDIDYKKRFRSRNTSLEGHNVTNAISHATCTTAYDLGAAAVIAVTISGQTARMISKFRPDIPIVGCTSSPRTWRQLSLSWGVVPVMVEEQQDLDGLIRQSAEAAQRRGIVRSGEVVVVTTGVPVGISGTTNLIKVHVVGDVLVSGRGVNRKIVCGSLCVAPTDEDVVQRFQPGDILVVKETNNAILGLLKQASGIVTEEDGMNSHAAIVGLALDIPVIVGAKGATNLLKSGTIITLDAETGVVTGSGPAIK